MTVRLALRGTALLAALVLLTPGCSGKKPLEPVAIKGKVAGFDRTQIVLRFHPQDTANKDSSPSLVVKDGMFSGSAIPGRYKVTVSPVPREGSGGAAGGPSTGGGTPGSSDINAIPETLRDAAKSPWEVDVPREGKEDIVFTKPN